MGNDESIRLEKKNEGYKPPVVWVYIVSEKRKEKKENGKNGEGTDSTPGPRFDE